MLIRFEMLDYFGIVGEISFCIKDLCKNGGVCIIMDIEIKCDCSRIEYEGEFCEIGEFVVIFLY